MWCTKDIIAIYAQDLSLIILLISLCKLACIDALELLVCDSLLFFVSLTYMQWWKQTCILLDVVYICFCFLLYFIFKVTLQDLPLEHNLIPSYSLVYAEKTFMTIIMVICDM